MLLNRRSTLNKINLGRVLLGGLVAGLISNAGEVVLNDIILGSAHRSRHEADGSHAAGHWIRSACRQSHLHLRDRRDFDLCQDACSAGAWSKDRTANRLVLWFCLYAYSGTINMLLINVPPKLILMILGWALLSIRSAFSLARRSTESSEVSSRVRSSRHHQLFTAGHAAGPRRPRTGERPATTRDH